MCVQWVPLQVLSDSLDLNKPEAKPARLAQSVERETLRILHHLKVVGSTPTSGSIPVDDSVFTFCTFFIFFFFLPSRLGGVGWWGPVVGMGSSREG